MLRPISSVIRVTDHLAIAWAGMICLLFPGIVLFLGHHTVAAIIETEAEVNANIASRMISENPLLWRYESLRLEEFLSRRPFDGTREVRRIVDQDGNVVARSGDELSWPVIIRSADLLDSGHSVGKLEISRSLRGLLQRAAAFAAGGVVLGGLMLAFIRMFPLRALSETLASLDELNETLKRRVDEEVRKGREKDHLLMHQSRLAAMGEMIGSIAHQWRQPLNVIGLVIQDIKGARHTGELDDRYLDESVARAMSIIRHMSSTIDDFRFFFRPEKEPSDFHIGEEVSKTVSIIEPSFAAGNISLRLDIQDDIIAHGFSNEYSQVLLNLLGNARDTFMERETPHPKVEIRLFRQNDRSVLTVSDNAGGIPEDIMDKIFDPYFTTKKNKGTGIGLYMSKLIIEKSMNGEITAANTGEGAEFRVSL